MNPREREIGKRLKEFRKGINFSQGLFAKQIGLTRDQLAAIEYGRTPIKYIVAWKIRETFHLSVDWLWGGDLGPDDLSEDRILPLPTSPKFNENSLLTEVFKQVYNLPDELLPQKAKPPKVSIDKTEVDHRWLLNLSLGLAVDQWIARVPNGYTRDFYDKICELAKRYLEAAPKDSEEIIEARFHAIRWMKMRSKAIDNLPAARIFQANPKTDLTKRQTSGNIDGVKSLWQSLKRRLQSATNEAGKKSELANYLKVDLSLVSRWLGETKHAREPGAEYTLLMLHWVEQQERQK